MPLPLGEVAERSEDGEGWNSVAQLLTRKDRKALSVTFGDSSPRGRAKGWLQNLTHVLFPNNISKPELPVSEFFQSIQRTKVFLVQRAQLPRPNLHGTIAERPN